MNRKLWAIHNWVGLYAGIAIAFLSITGAMALFKDEVDVALNPRLFRSAQPGVYHDSLSAKVRQIVQQYSEEDFNGISFPTGPQNAWQIKFFKEGKYDYQSTAREVFLDPANAQVLGERDMYHTFAFYLRNLHVRFYEGQFGRQIVGLAGLALLLSTITGFLIYGAFMKRQFFADIRNKNLRVQMADWHKLVGIATLAFNLMIAITGTWLGWQGYLQKWLAIERPNTWKRSDKPLDPQADAAYPTDYVAVLNATKACFPELIPGSIRPSDNGAATIEILGDVAGAAYEPISHKLILDKRNLQALYQYDIRAQGFGDQLFFVQESLHFGNFGGIGLKLLYVFFALTSGFLSLTGFVIYLKRTENARRKEKPTFVELKPLLLRYTGAMLGFILLIGILSVWLGIGIPTLLVTTGFYLGLVTWLLWSIVKFARKRWFTKNVPLVVTEQAYAEETVYP